MRRLGLLATGLVISTALVAAPLLAGGVTQDQLRAAAKAEQLEKNEQWREAAAEYDKVYQADASNRHALHKAAEMWRRAGEPDKALGLYQPLAQDRAYTYPALRAMAGIRAVQGRTGQAVRLLRRLQARGWYGLQDLRSHSDFERIRSSSAFRALVRFEESRPFPVRQRTPTWSPDGTRIAFVSSDSSFGGSELFVVDADGSNLRRLTQSRASEVFPKWSPDGTEILFVREGTDLIREHGIFAITPDAASERKVLGAWSEQSLPASFNSAGWCPDSSCITFLGADPDDARQGNFHLYLMDRDGGNVRRIEVPKQAYRGSPTVAPDGKRVCFDVLGRGEWRYETTYNIDCAELAGGPPPKRLLAGLYWWYPSWSSDGSVFVSGLWTSGQDRFGRVAVVEEDTGDYTYITPEDMDAWWPAVSPDGKQVAFGAGLYPFGEEKRLYLVNIDGSNLRLLVPSAAP